MTGEGGEGGCVFNSLLRERIHGKIPQLVPPPSQLVLATTEALTLALSLQVILEPNDASYTRTITSCTSTITSCTITFTTSTSANTSTT